MVPKVTILSVYFALFYSHMNYYAQIWGQLVYLYVGHICTLQNTAIRIICFAKIYTPLNTLYANLGLHDLKLPSPLLDTFAVGFSHAYYTYSILATLSHSLPIIQIG